MPFYQFHEAQAIAAGSIMTLASVPANADSIRFRVESATCRYIITGATPNASLGLMVTPADPVTQVALGSAGNFRLYAIAAAQVNVTYMQGGDTFKL